MNSTLDSDRVVVCAAIPGSGVRHRFVMMSSVKHFADLAGYSMRVLWGVTRGVACCRFEELFAPLPGIQVVNVPAAELAKLASLVKTEAKVNVCGQLLPVFRADEKKHGLPKRFFTWDLVAGGALASMVGGNRRALEAKPAANIVKRVEGYMRRHAIERRLGIRVRVDECFSRNRKPHRIQRELDDVLKQIVQLPWHTKVFIATDSQYIQTMLGSHFNEAAFLPKNFDLKEATGAYIHRLDKKAMFTYMQELTCLCSCRKIINVGGFLNEHAVKDKILEAPYEGAIVWTRVRSSYGPRYSSVITGR